MSVSTTLSRGLAAAAALVLGACSNSGEPAAGSAELRVLHATPSLGAVDVLVGGTPVITGLASGTSSARVLIPTGQQRFTVRSGADLVGELQYTPTESHLNSLVISDSALQFTDVVEPDTGQPAPAMANIRIVNVVGSNLSPPTDLQLQFWTALAPDSVIKSNFDATVPTYWSLWYFPPGDFSIRYVPAGGVTVLAEADFHVAAGEKKAAVLGRAADGTYHVEVVIEP